MAAVLVPVAMAVTSGFVVAWAPEMTRTIMEASPTRVPLRVTVTVPVSEPVTARVNATPSRLTAVPVLSVESQSR